MTCSGGDATIAPWNTCCARRPGAEARHFWFRGFRRFVTPLVRSAARGTDRARASSTAAAARAPTSSSSDGSAAPTGSTCRRSAPGSPARPAGPPIARATVTAAPFPSGAFDLVTSFDVLYSLEEPDEAAAVGELFRRARSRAATPSINVAAMPMLTGDHSVLSHERRRYTRSSLRLLLERAGFTIVRLTYTNATLFLPLAMVRGFHRWRGLSTEAEAQQEIAVPAAPSTAP